MQEQVNQLYQRDIARMAGEGKDTKGMEDEYKTFLAELGGKDPRELGGSGWPLLPPHCPPPPTPTPPANPARHPLAHSSSLMHEQCVCSREPDRGLTAANLQTGAVACPVCIFTSESVHPVCGFLLQSRCI